MMKDVIKQGGMMSKTNVYCALASLGAFIRTQTFVDKRIRESLMSKYGFVEAELAEKDKEIARLKEENEKLHTLIKGVEKYREVIGEYQVIILSKKEYEVLEMHRDHSKEELVTLVNLLEAERDNLKDNGDMLQELDKKIKRFGNNIAICYKNNMYDSAIVVISEGETLEKAILKAREKK